MWNGLVYVFGSVFKVFLYGAEIWQGVATNVVLITIVGVSPVVQPYTTVMSPYTFGVVGVAPVCLPYTSVVLPYTSVVLPYTSVVLPYTSVSLPYTFRKPPLDFCIPPLHYILAIKKQRNRGYIDWYRF